MKFLDNFWLNLCSKLVILLSVLSVTVNCDEFKCKEEPTKKIFCYYKSQMTNEISQEFPSKIFHHNKPPCSHIIFGFAGLNMDGNIAMPHSRDFHDILKLKDKDPCLKVLIAVGGWDEGSEKFSSLVENEESIANFTEKALKFLIFYGFDGIDIHWMYPTMRNGIKEDRENFVKLIKSLKRKLTKRNKLVVAAIGMKSVHISQAYNPIKELCDSLDHTILLSYDFYERSETSIGAPLVNDDNHIYRETIAENVDKILSQNCAPEKLIFGISTYGRIFNLKRSTKNHIGADLSDEESHFVECSKIRTALKRNSSLAMNSHNKPVKWTTKLLPKSLSKYSFHDRIWVSFDDFEAVELKTLFSLKKNLGGVMFYSLNGDSYSEDLKTYFPVITRAKKMIEEITRECHKGSTETCIKQLEKDHNLSL